MKTSKRWNYLKSQLQTAKGFWHMKACNKSLILKLDKQQDRYHRRFFLKPLKCAENNVYLSHEKKLSQAENNKKLVIRLSYSQDSPINRRISPLSSRKKSMLNFALNPVAEDVQQEEKPVNENETVIENRGSSGKKHRNSEKIKQTVKEQLRKITKEKGNKISLENTEELLKEIPQDQTLLETNTNNESKVSSQDTPSDDSLSSLNQENLDVNEKNHEKAKKQSNSNIPYKIKIEEENNQENKKMSKYVRRKLEQNEKAQEKTTGYTLNKIEENDQTNEKLSVSKFQDDGKYTRFSDMQKMLENNKNEVKTFVQISDKNELEKESMLISSNEKEEKNEDKPITRFTLMKQAFEQQEDEKIKGFKLHLQALDSRNTFKTNKSYDTNQAFIENEVDNLGKSVPVLSSIQSNSNDIFKFNNNLNNEVENLEKPEEIPYDEEESYHILDQPPPEHLVRIHSEQLMDKKKENWLQSPINNRSATKAILKNRTTKQKNHHKNMLGYYKENRKLQFTHVDLKKYSNKEVEDLELEFHDGGIALNRESNKRQAVRFTAEPHQFYAEKISIKGAHYGLIELTRENFMFRSLGVERPDKGPSYKSDVQEPGRGDPLYELFPLGIDSKSFLTSHCKKQWNLCEIASVHGRSYNLRHCAFENKAYFFNVYDTKFAEEIIVKFQKLKKNKTDFFYNRDEAFKNSGIQEKWLKGQISNFEYLSLVNTYAGRTFNDINQYPVFPWVVTDYTSTSLDLNNPNIFRNLSLPIGALMPKRLEEAREHYETLCMNVEAELHEKAFEYGTHYSGLGPVSYFLVRLEPFATEHIRLQSGNFDDTDRLFASIGKTWEICYEQDFKELLPEMYYLPDFLMNKNGFDFGKGNAIGNVELPNWAKSPYEFVFRHREALECDYVSKNLHNWIDLIFGYKQQGKAALEADNVFRCLTYEGTVDLTKVRDITQRKNYLEYITKLGQTPHQLFNYKHPSKNITRFDEKSIFKGTLNINQNSNGVEKFEGISDANIIKIGFGSNCSDIVLLLTNSILVTIPRETTTFDNQLKRFPIDMEKRKFYQITSKFSQNELCPSSQICFLKKKKRVVLMGGFYDGSLKVFVKGKEMKKAEINGEFLHKKPIICISVCEECKIVACGSKDCRISLWKFDKDMGLKLNMEAGGLIYGHNNEIITLKINDVLDILISIDRDGALLMHEIRKGRFIRKIDLDMDRDEFVNNLDIHDNGLILIGTTSCRIFVYRLFCYFCLKISFLQYSLNGDLINSMILKNEMKYNYKFTDMKFISKWNSYFGVSDTEGDMHIYDAFSLEVINQFK